MKKITPPKFFITKKIALAISAAVVVFAAPAQAEDSEQIEEVVVLGNSSTFGNSLVTEAMQRQQSSLTSINALIDNLPGVTVNEGDTYGFDDWSTAITVRGFQTNLGEQQVGSTIDGMPNGNSNYGGGSKANRFIDPANLAGVEVSQGTADIASRSHEALGGTLNYLTDSPLDERRFRTEVSLGEFDARRIYLRYDTGTIGENTQAWVSYSAQEASDWVGESADNERDHFAFKLTSSLGMADITAYVAYDDIHEDNYQRVYSAAQFENFPETDFLNAEWTGIPHNDQLFRQAWSTLRENLFGYVKADFDFSEDLKLSASIYNHQNEGRGDWVPPYLVDVTTDTAGQSEFLGGTVTNGGAAGPLITFVDPAGNQLTPAADCVLSGITNIYGTADATSDPACFPADAIAVQSYRHTHYEKDRTGLNFDLTWNNQVGDFDNEVRAGLWYEDQTRDEFRDWHNITGVDAQFDPEPYWIQYSRSYPQETTKWYLQDSLTTGALTWTAGIKKFLVDVEREDLFDSSLNDSVNSDSDVMFSGGLVWDTNVDGLEAFFGYAENYRALSDTILERESADTSNIEPETSETTEIGIRYSGDNLQATAVYYQNDFENRIIFLDNSATGNVAPNFLIGTNGTYFNAGGIESSGLELAINYSVNSNFSLYTAYTYSDATYLGSGDATVDSLNGVASGNEVTGIAENLLVVSLDWVSDNKFAGISAKYTDDRFVNTANTWVADAYTVTDIYVGAEMGEYANFLQGMSLNFVVNNLLDEDYLGTIAQNAAWIGASRAYSLSATFDF